MLSVDVILCWLLFKILHYLLEEVQERPMKGERDVQGYSEFLPEFLTNPMEAFLFPLAKGWHGSVSNGDIFILPAGDMRLMIFLILHSSVSPLRLFGVLLCESLWIGFGVCDVMIW